MKIVLVLLVAVGVASASPVTPGFIEILSQSEVRDEMGQYALQYQTANGITNIEQGAFIPSDDGLDMVLVKQGSYSFTTPEGTLIEVVWTAGKDGYKAEIR